MTAIWSTGSFIMMITRWYHLHGRTAVQPGGSSACKGIIRKIEWTTVRWYGPVTSAGTRPTVLISSWRTAQYSTSKHSPVRVSSKSTSTPEYTATA